MSATPEDPAHPSPPAGVLDLSERIARAASVARPEPRISRNAVLAIVAVFVLLGVTGGVVDNFLNAHVVTPTPPTIAAPALVPVPAARQAGTTAALMSLDRARGRAPGFTLADQSGHQVSLASLRHKVVVLSFFDAPCDDLCPVLAAELRAAARDLGPLAGSVAFVTVNADPLAPGAQAAAEGAARSHLGGPGGLANWRFLSGPLATLNTIWKRYDMTIDVQRATGRVSHNDTMWFVSPSGRLAYEATPFAEEQRATGTYQLAAATEARFGAGIAHYARALLPGRRAGS